MTEQEKCEFCGTVLIENCLKCGAPVCCPACCAADNEKEWNEVDRALGAAVRAEIKELRENEHRSVTESLALVILLDLEKKAGVMK